MNELIQRDDVERALHAYDVYTATTDSPSFDGMSRDDLLFMGRMLGMPGAYYRSDSDGTLRAAVESLAEDPVAVARATQRLASLFYELPLGLEES